MPSGATHAKWSAVLAVPCFGAGYLLTRDPVVGGACAAGCLLGIPMTPDLDQEGLSAAEHRIVKYTLGLGFLWAMVWYPYARICPHRGALSHWPLLGTAGRLLYLALYVGLLAAVGAYFDWWAWPQASAPSWLSPESPGARAALWALVGLVVSDTAHWAADMTESPARRAGRLASRRASGWGRGYGWGGAGPEFGGAGRRHGAEQEWGGGRAASDSRGTRRARSRSR